MNVINDTVVVELEENGRGASNERRESAFTENDISTNNTEKTSDDSNQMRNEELPLITKSRIEIIRRRNNDAPEEAITGKTNSAFENQSERQLFPSEPLLDKDASHSKREKDEAASKAEGKYHESTELLKQLRKV
jgi:hypothetical protein